MERIIDGKKPLTNNEKALKISLGFWNRENDTVLVALESHTVFTEDSESIRDWAAKNKQTLVLVKKDGKLLIGENSEVPTVEEAPKEDKPKKGKK
jgi:hypothetical protein